MPDLIHSARVLMLETYPDHCPPQYAAVWREGSFAPNYVNTRHARLFDTRAGAIDFLANHKVAGGYTFCELIVDVCHGHCTMMLVPTHVIRNMPVGAAGDIAYGDGDVTRLILDHLRDCSADRPSESVLSD